MKKPNALQNAPIISSVHTSRRTRAAPCAADPSPCLLRYSRGEPLPRRGVLQIHLTPLLPRLSPVFNNRVGRPQPIFVVSLNPFVESAFPAEEVNAQLLPSLPLIHHSAFEPLRGVAHRPRVHRVTALADFQNIAPHHLQRLLPRRGEVAPRPEPRNGTLRASHHTTRIWRGRRARRDTRL